MTADMQDKASVTEAPTALWRYDIQYGPDGETNYAWVYCGAEMVATMRTYNAKRICDGMNAALSVEKAPAVETPPPVPHLVGDPALIGIAETIEESGGHWRPCSGCYDTEDGHPTQKYDFSPALRTAIGCGCTECGGLGATWEHYTAEEVEQMVRGEVDDEIEILSRLATGDTVVYSQDGDYGWFTKGDRAFVGDAIMSLRQKGFLLRQCDDEENYRGMSEYDTISDAGRAHLAVTTEGSDNANS